MAVTYLNPWDQWVNRISRLRNITWPTDFVCLVYFVVTIPALS
jgi:hypothetical protein